MTGTIKKFLLGASVVASLSALTSAPASAASIKNATVTGAAPYLTYDADAKNTFLVNNTPGTWVNEQKVLGGDSTNPTGNIELFSNSENLNNSAYESYTGVTSLQGTIGGKSIILSSLTAADWEADGKKLAKQWLSDLFAANNLSSLLGTNTESDILTAFIAGGGRQRFSDPNISYVNQDNDGTIRIGLAGHFNAVSLIQQALQPTQVQLKSGYELLKATRSQLQSTLNQLNNSYNFASASQKLVLLAQINALKAQIAVVDGQITTILAKLDPLNAFIAKTDLVIQASEIVKVAYDGGPAQYLYSFNATATGLVEKGDGKSHNGNYEVALRGEVPPSESVPEPSTMLSLLGLGGLFALKRKSKKLEA